MSTTEGRRVVTVGAYRVEIVEPYAAGEFDPPMQDWLQLPVADSCPEDPAHETWGTSNPQGYFYVRRCHVCGARFRPEVSLNMIRSVVGALTGESRRFARGNL